MDANFPQVCGQHRSVDTSYPPAQSAQAAFRSNTTRLLVSERVTYYASSVSAAQVLTSLSLGLNCGTGTLAGRKVTVSGEHPLPAAIADRLDASGSRALHTTGVDALLIVMRSGRAVAQLSIASLTGTPSAAVTNSIAAKAAARLAAG